MIRRQRNSSLPSVQKQPSRTAAAAAASSLRGGSSSTRDPNKKRTMGDNNDNDRQQQEHNENDDNDEENDEHSYSSSESESGWFPSCSSRSGEHSQSGEDDGDDGPDDGSHSSSAKECSSGSSSGSSSTSNDSDDDDDDLESNHPRRHSHHHHHRSAQRRKQQQQQHVRSFQRTNRSGGSSSNDMRRQQEASPLSGARRRRSQGNATGLLLQQQLQQGGNGGPDKAASYHVVYDGNKLSRLSNSSSVVEGNGASAATAAAASGNHGGGNSSSASGFSRRVKRTSPSWLQRFRWKRQTKRRNFWNGLLLWNHRYYSWSESQHGRQGRKFCFCCPALFCSALASFWLCTTFTVWLVLCVIRYSGIAFLVVIKQPPQQGYLLPSSPLSPLGELDRSHFGNGLTLRRQQQQQRNQQRFNVRVAEPSSNKGSLEDFVHDVKEGIKDWVGYDKGELKLPKKPPFKKKHSSVEDLKPGCVRAAWQDYNFPNCNQIHEIDLRDVLERRRERRAIDNDKEIDAQPHASTLGYVAAGMWRTVWAVDPSAVMPDPLVLKVMKQEHDVDHRNFDRHRRDALVMERLTSSPYVVDIFGFCGNTVLTEYIATTLSDIIEDATSTTAQLKPASNTSTTTSSFLPATRHTPESRFRLALDVARGMKAIHEISGGPIIHADLQAKQFLVNRNGTVKVNDFNRCRFMAHKNVTGALCPLRIPSAPGKARAPEEYNYDALDAKMDVYSTANVYYGILTGLDPWEGWSRREMINLMNEKGAKPLVPEKFRRHALDQILANLTDRAYELHPKDRISAAELVAELEQVWTSMTSSNHHP